MRTHTKVWALVTVVLLAVALVAPPAVAAEAPVGPRVGLIAGTPTTLPADSSFHVLHGWVLEPSQQKAIGQADFRLDVDGVDQGKGSLINSGAAGDTPLLRLWLYNFENGLSAGQHTFTGHWFLACGDAVAGGFFPGPCPRPNAPVEALTLSLTVLFT